MKAQSLVAVLMASAFLTACGGSSGGSSSGAGIETPDPNAPGAGTTEPDTVVLNNDSAMANENSDGVVIPVFANDEGITAVLKSTLNTSIPAHGSLTVNDDGTLSYEPNADYYGDDTFTYSVTDSANEKTYEATVTVTINPVTTLATVMTYPSPDTIRNFGGASTLQVRGLVTNQDGSAASSDDVVRVQINGADVALNNENLWQTDIALEKAASSKITAVTQALDSSESYAETTIKNEALIGSFRRIAYAGDEVTYIVDEFNHTLIKSDLSVELGHQSIVADRYLNSEDEHKIRDVSWDKDNNRIILAADIHDISDTAKVVSIDPDNGELQLLYQDPTHERYSALTWIGNDQFLALSGDESSSSAQLIHVDISDPDSPIRTPFSGRITHIDSDIIVHDNRIYMTLRNENSLLSIGLPEEGELWSSYSLVTGTIDSESKGTGPDLDSPRGLVITGSHAYIAQNNNLARVVLASGDRAIVNDEFVFPIGIDVRHDLETPDPQLLLTDDSKKALYRVDVSSSEASIEALNTTSSGEHFIDPLSIALKDSTAFVADYDRILSVSMVNGNREVLDAGLPSDASFTSLQYDAINQWLFAADSRNDAIYKIDLSNAEDITYSVLASGITNRVRDMTLMEIDGVRRLIITNRDGLDSINVNTGNSEVMAINLPNTNDILKIEAGESALYLLQHNYSGVLKLTQDDSGCFCNQQEYSAGGTRPSSTLVILEDKSTAYFHSTASLYAMDLATAGATVTTVTPESNVVLYRSPSNSVFNPTTNTLLTVDASWGGIFETDIQSGHTSVVSQ